LPAAANANIIVHTAPTARRPTVSRKERPLQAGAAVRYRELRRILQQIVIAGLPVTAAGCVEAVIDTDCIDTVERTYEFDIPADPPLQFLINRCSVDVEACEDLCQEAMERNNVMRQPSSCDVALRDTSVEIDVSYEVFGGGCPVDDFPPIEGRIAPDSVDAAREAAARELGSGTDLSSSVPGLSDAPQARGLDARALDSIWNGGRTWHA
jgi:hypothetical protein